MVLKYIANPLVRWICAFLWYNRAKFVTNGADIVQINIQIGGILKLSYFWQNFNMPISHKGFDHRSKAAKNVFSSLFI